MRLTHSLRNGELQGEGSRSVCRFWLFAGFLTSRDHFGTHGSDCRSIPERYLARQKTLPLGPGGLSNGSQILCADYVCRLKALGALEQVKLHGLAFIQRAVAVFLNCREVYKHIFSCRALDKSVSFRSVEPLHCTFLSHGNYSFHQSRRMILQILGLLRIDPKPPSKNRMNFFRLRLTSREELLPKRKRLLCSRWQWPSAPGTLGVRQFGAFPPHPTNVNQPLVLTTGANLQCWATDNKQYWNVSQEKLDRSRKDDFGSYFYNFNKD